VPPPAFDDDLGLAQSVEDLAVEQFVTQPRVETHDSINPFPLTIDNQLAILVLSS